MKIYSKNLKLVTKNILSVLMLSSVLSLVNYTNTNVGEEKITNKRIEQEKKDKEYSKFKLDKELIDSLDLNEVISKNDNIKEAILEMQKTYKDKQLYMNRPHYYYEENAIHIYEKDNSAYLEVGVIKYSKNKELYLKYSPSNEYYKECEKKLTFKLNENNICNNYNDYINCSAVSEDNKIYYNYETRSKNHFFTYQSIKATTYDLEDLYGDNNKVSVKISKVENPVYKTRYELVINDDKPIELTFKQFSFISELIDSYGSNGKIQDFFEREGFIQDFYIEGRKNNKERKLNLL